MAYQFFHYKKRFRYPLYLLGLIGLCLGIFVVVLETRLPNIETLKNIQLQVPLRIYTADGELINEYGDKRRIPVNIEMVPKPLIQALLATEDQRFYEHPGVDVFGLARAMIKVIKTGTKAQGGSTITMQVARNFFLSSKKTYIRKLNEILLAIKIDHNLSKEKILSLYLNKIYLGNRAYGVGAAAQVYYGKPLNKLTLAEQAMIAGLPKAPSKLNPLASPEKARQRRNHVLMRMREEGYITKAQYLKARAAPITAHYHERKVTVYAPYVSEMVRQDLLKRFGKNAYTDGYQVTTTILADQQEIGNRTVREGLLAHERRHGFDGPLDNLGIPNPLVLEDWQKQLQRYPSIQGFHVAAVLEVFDMSTLLLLKDGKTVEVNWSGLSWAAPKQLNQKDNLPSVASEILHPGDVIHITKKRKQWVLTKLPTVEGALVAMRPNTGAITALVGGFNFAKSNFNRVTQATRQPGSAFKPFIYAAALEKGYTLASLINDAPIVVNDLSQGSLWRPQNDTHRFYGPTRLRVGLIHSRNLVSIRLLDEIGIDYTRDYLTRFGFSKRQSPNNLSLALGSLDTTPLQLTAAYAMLANGGFYIEPYLISKIQNSLGETVMEAQPKIACPDCQTNDDPPKVPVAQQAPRIMNPKVAYLINSVLQDVIQHGTGRAARVLKRSDLAGKTGTTNDHKDAWFSGFNRNLVSTVWIGYDTPKSLHEYAAKAALPMWINFMRHALKHEPTASLPEPPGMLRVKIDKHSGKLATSTQSDVLFEVFRKEYAPKEIAPEKSREESINQEDDDRNSDIEEIF